MKKCPTSINIDDYLKELEQYRPKGAQRLLTYEQKKFLILARQHPRPIPYRTIVEIWNSTKSWDKVSVDSVIRMYNSQIRDKHITIKDLK